MPAFLTEDLISSLASSISPCSSVLKLADASATRRADAGLVPGLPLARRRRGRRHWCVTVSTVPSRRPFGETLRGRRPSPASPLRSRRPGWLGWSAMASYLITGVSRGHRPGAGRAADRRPATRSTASSRTAGSVPACRLAGVGSSWTWPSSAGYPAALAPLLDRCPSLDGLVHCAGIVRPGRLADAEPSRFHRAVRGQRGGRGRAGPAVVAGVAGGGRDGGAGQFRLRPERPAAAGRPMARPSSRCAATPRRCGRRSRPAGLQRSIRAGPPPTCSARSGRPRPATTEASTTCDRRRWPA